MGYRNYIATMPKKDYNKIKNLSKDELYIMYNKADMDEDEKYIGVYEFGTTLYNFGKYVNFKYPEKSKLPFFKNKKTQHKFDSDDELYVVTKEFFEAIINSYKEKIQNYYKELVYTMDRKDHRNWTEKQIIELYEHVDSMASEWIKLEPFELNDNKNSITNSWKYEYSIFELVRIYKSFDWKKNVMIYYGY